MSIPISSIGQAPRILTVDPIAPATPGSQNKSVDFGSLLNSAITQVEAQRTKADLSIQRFLSGQGEELHNVAIATQRADIAFDLGMQIRNKIVSAYQEIMKMQL
jgi:flagellar hook-basal body complex protein FliE